MSKENLHLTELKRLFIEKTITNYGEKYPSIVSKDFKNTNLTALINDILEDNKSKFLKDNPLKKFLISEPTLRRIFIDEQKKTTFQVPTRNFIAYYLGYKNFDDFVNKYKLPTPQDKENSEEQKVTSEPFTEIQDNHSVQTNSTPTKAYRWLLISLVVMAVSAFFIISRNSEKDFSGKITKIRYENNVAPITINFEYKFSDNDYKNAHLNYKQKGIIYKGDTTAIENNTNQVSVCFLHPTIRTVRLIANNKKLDSIKVIIPSDGWVAGYSGIYYLDKSLWKKNGVAHIDKKDIIEKVKSLPEYYSFVKKVGNFPNNSADDLILETRLKNPTAEGGIICNDATIGIIGSENQVNLNLTNSGCSYFSYLNLPDKNIQGRTHDLSKLAINLNDFINLKIQLSKSTIAVFIDNRMVYGTTYSKKLGKIEAIHIGFKGVGSIDFIKLSSLSNKRILDYENF